MVALWNDPERARAIGARARAWVERHHTLERFCANVSSAIDAALVGGAATGAGWWDARTSRSAVGPGR